MQTPPGWRQTLTSCWVFPAIIAWKIVLMGAWALPPPANDAFFYDGAVVNWLRQGDYVNPALARALPISGTVVFSAYPPGYEAVLAVWMAIFGPSGQSAQGLHVGLFAVFAGLALAVLRHLGVAARAANLGGLFLLGITFHDRPDSVAQVLGLFAFYCWIRAWRLPAAVLLAATALTSLHIGAMYAAAVWWFAVSARRENGTWPVALPFVVATVFALAVGGIFLRWPQAWAGFREHLAVTPSLAGLRWPEWDVLAKVGRTVPGLLLLGTWAVVAGARRPSGLSPALRALALPALGVVAGALFVLAPNYVQAAAYPQVLVVALAWPALVEAGAPARLRPIAHAVVVGGVALVSIRAVGLSTWGVACAIDVGAPAAIRRVQQVVRAQPDRSTALVSSAYLYSLAGDSRVACVLADWPGAWTEGEARPTCLVLTAYDYYRRYQRELDALVARGVVTITGVEQQGTVPPPDAFPRWQRVVQHVAWAPVIVRLEWR